MTSRQPDQNPNEQDLPYEIHIITTTQANTDEAVLTLSTTSHPDPPHPTTKTEAHVHEHTSQLSNLHNSNPTDTTPAHSQVPPSPASPAWITFDPFSTNSISPTSTLRPPPQISPPTTSPTPSEPLSPAIKALIDLRAQEIYAERMTEPFMAGKRFNPRRIVLPGVEEVVAVLKREGWRFGGEIWSWN